MTKEAIVTTIITCVLAGCAADPWPQVWAAASHDDREISIAASKVRIAQQAGLDVELGEPGYRAHVVIDVRDVVAADAIPPRADESSGCRWITIDRVGGAGGPTIAASGDTLAAALAPAARENGTIIPFTGDQFDPRVSQVQRDAWRSYHKDILSQTCEVDR